MVDKDHLYTILNEGILAERLGAFRSNLQKNIDMIRRYGGLRRVVPDLEGMTAVVIGAGPSLDNNIDVLKRYQERREFSYIAVDMALRPLMKQGISPRYVLSCETSPVDFFGGIDTSRMHLIAFSCMSHFNLRRWRGDISFYNWMMQGEPYRGLWETAGLDLGFVGTGSLVTTQAIAFAMGCGITGLIMAGNDLGFSDRFYARGSVGSMAIHRGSGRLAPAETGEMDRARRVMEYHIQRGDRRYCTTGQFLAAKMWLEGLFAAGGIPVYDASEPGCSEKYVAKIDLKDFMYTFDARHKRRRRKT